MHRLPKLKRARSPFFSMGVYAQTAENFPRRQRVLWLWVKSLVPPGQYKIVIRTRYQRYIGAFVLHCHILDHEDQGMMQNISVALPDGKVSVSHGHH